MNHRRQRRRRWCIRILKGVAVLLVLILVGFGVIQGLLQTSWARGKAAAKVSPRVAGLPVKIEKLGWTPWNGATVEGLTVFQPVALAEVLEKPLLEIDRIHAWPDYASLFRGRLRANDLTIESPRLCVSIQMLASIAAQSLPEAEPPTVTMAARTEDQGESVLNPSPGVISEDSEESEEVGSMASMDEEPEGGELASQTKDGRELVHVRVNQGSFLLVSVGRPEPLASLEGVDLDLPLFSELSLSDCFVGELGASGQTVEKGLLSKLRVRGRTLYFQIPEDRGKSSKLFGYFALGLMEGLPFQVDLNLRLERLGQTPLNQVLAVEVDRIESRIEGVGWLQSPPTWNGRCRFGTSQLVTSLYGQAATFDSAVGTLQLSGGVLQSPDFRLLGDSASLLGNGWLTSQDGSAVVRVVVPYEMVGLLNTELAKRAPDGRFVFSPLQPDNRWFSDVAVWRRESGWSVALGKGGSEFELGELKSLMQSGDLPDGAGGGKE